MRPELRAHADRQGGLVTRAQAVEAGYTERELRTATAVHGPWVIVRRGVYVDRNHWDSLTGYDDQAILVDRAVHLSMRTPHLMSHDSAARMLGIPMLRPQRPLSHVTREGLVGTRTDRGVKHHLTRLGLLTSQLVDDMWTTGPARTALDLAREHGLAAGVIACDHVLHGGLSRRSLEDEVLLMWCWPNVTKAKAAIQLADAGAETIGESLTRLLVLECGIGTPETQLPVQTPSGIAWIDLAVGCHMIEFDGRVKLTPVERGGVATTSPELVVWEERRRQHEVCAEGLGMSRVGWDDLFGSARERTKRRIVDEYAVTASRFGHRLPPHLRAFADRVRGSRGRRTA